MESLCLKKDNHEDQYCDYCYCSILIVPGPSCRSVYWQGRGCGESLATHCDTRISNVGRNVGVKIGNVNEGNVLSWSHFHCASLRPRDYRELGANYYHKISAIKETFRLSSIMKILGDQFFYPSQIFWSFNEFYREEEEDILFIWPSFWWLGWFQSRGRVSLIWYSDMIEIFNFKSEGEIKEKCQHISSVSWEIDIGKTEYIYFIFCY